MITACFALTVVKSFVFMYDHSNNICFDLTSRQWILFIWLNVPMSVFIGINNGGVVIAVELVSWRNKRVVPPKAIKWTALRWQFCFFSLRVVGSFGFESTIGISVIVLGCHDVLSQSKKR